MKITIEFDIPEKTYRERIKSEEFITETLPEEFEEHILTSLQEFVLELLNVPEYHHVSMTPDGTTLLQDKNGKTIFQFKTLDLKASSENWATCS